MQRTLLYDKMQEKQAIYDKQTCPIVNTITKLQLSLATGVRSHELADYRGDSMKIGLGSQLGKRWSPAANSSQKQTKKQPPGTSDTVDFIKIKKM